MYLLSLAALVAMVTVGYCGNFSVTHEAWFEVEAQSLDGPGLDYRGRLVLALFGQTVPVTVMNFVALTKGHRHGKDKLHYKNSPVHRVVPDFVLQMGDITTGDGTGGRSIFGERFNDENFVLSHRSAGWAAMANHGADTNGSQFYILLNKARWLDGKHVVFAKVVSGYDVLEIIGEIPYDPNTGKPTKKIRIIDCGVEELDTVYDMTEEQLDATKDL